MLTTDTTIELGRLCSPDAATTGPRHQLFFLRERAIVVMPYARTSTGWNCVIVASRTLRPPHQLTLTGNEIAAASTTLAMQPERDPDGYARLAWQSQAFRHWPGGAMLALTRHLADRLRQPGSLTIPAAALTDYNAIAQLLPTTRPVAVGRLLDRLITAGLLTRVHPSQWRLTVPAAAARM